MKHQQKWDRLQDLLRSMESVLVAYSGGVDSTFLLKAASIALKNNAVAVTALSPSYPTYEWEETTRLVTKIGVRHIIVHTQELENPSYRANQGDRCYFCKGELYQVCAQKKQELGLKVIVNGLQADDREDDRPGFRAAKEFSVRSPLREAGFTKNEIRDLSQELGLSTWNKQALACLSSRFPVGTEVTSEKLQRIDRIETELVHLGFKTFRVRFHEPIARIEIGADDFSKILDPEVRRRVSALCRENGFSHATIDLETRTSL